MKNKTYTQFANLEFNKKSIKRTKSLGIIHADMVNSFNNFINKEEENKIYDFLRKWKIKMLIVFILLAFSFYLFGKRTIQFVSVPFEMIDEIMR